MDTLRRALEAIRDDAPEVVRFGNLDYRNDKPKYSDIENSDHGIDIGYLSSDDDDDDDDDQPFYEEDEILTSQVQASDIEDAARECMGKAVIFDPGYATMSGPLREESVPFRFSVQTQQLVLGMPGVLPDAPVAGVMIDSVMFHTNRRCQAYEARWQLQDTTVNMVLRQPQFEHSEYYDDVDDEDEVDSDTVYAAAGSVYIYASQEIIRPLDTPFFDAVLWNASAAGLCVDSRPPHIRDELADYEWWARNTHTATALLEFAYHHSGEPRETIHALLVNHIFTHYRLPCELARQVRVWVAERHQPIRLAEEIKLGLTNIDGSSCDPSVDDQISGTLTAFFAVSTRQ